MVNHWAYWQATNDFGQAVDSMTLSRLSSNELQIKVLVLNQNDSSDGGRRKPSRLIENSLSIMAVSLISFFLCLTIIISFSYWSSPHNSELTWKKKVNYGISKDASLFLSRCCSISMKKKRIIAKWKWKLKRDLSFGWRNLSSLNKNDESSCDFNSFFFSALFLFLVPRIESDDHETFQRAGRCWESLWASSQITRAWTNTILGPQALPWSHQTREQARRITIPKGPHRHHGFGTESNEIIQSFLVLMCVLRVWSCAWSYVDECVSCNRLAWNWLSIYLKRWRKKNQICASFDENIKCIL